MCERSDCNYTKTLIYRCPTHEPSEIAEDEEQLFYPYDADVFEYGHDVRAFSSCSFMDRVVIFRFMITFGMMNQTNPQYSPFLFITFNLARPSFIFSLS